MTGSASPTSIGFAPMTRPTFRRSTPSIGGCFSAIRIDDPLMPAAFTPWAISSFTISGLTT
jgi:hypothetical protein